MKSQSASIFQIPQWAIHSFMIVTFAIMGFLLRSAYGDIITSKTMVEKHDTQIAEITKRLDNIDTKLETNRVEYRQDSAKMAEKIDELLSLQKGRS